MNRVDSIWLALVGGFMSGSLPLIVGWLINRRKGRVDNDKNLWELYEDVRDRLVKLEASHAALLRSVQAERYEVAERIIRRAGLKQ